MKNATHRITIILRVLSALFCAALIAAIVVPSQWAIKNRPAYDYIYPAALWGSMLLFAIWPGILARPRVLASEHLALVMALGSFVLCMPLLRDQNSNYRKALGAGALLGLSFATRYAAMLALPAFILALALTKQSLR